jgi:hypothetical protein
VTKRCWLYRNVVYNLAVNNIYSQATINCSTMYFKEKQDKTTEIGLPPRTKTSERECPRCDDVLCENQNEQCYECLTCGYIDCGGE